MEGRSQSKLQGETFSHRHIGPNKTDQQKMLEILDLKNGSDLLDRTLPQDILYKELICPSQGLAESEFLLRARSVANKNQIYKSYLGRGYYDTPYNWNYSSYHSGKSKLVHSLYALPSRNFTGSYGGPLNFQTMVADLTGLPIANSSLLDEGTAAAEAMTMSQSVNKLIQHFCC